MIEVAGGVQEPKQFDSIVDGPVVEAVFVERIAAAMQSQFRSRAAKCVPLGEVFEFFPKPLNEPVGLQFAVFSDVVPNVPDVGE